MLPNSRKSRRQSGVLWQEVARADNMAYVHDKFARWAALANHHSRNQLVLTCTLLSMNFYNLASTEFMNNWSDLGKLRKRAMKHHHRHLHSVFVEMCMKAVLPE